jgi:hypothetical protein
MKSYLLPKTQLSAWLSRVQANRTLYAPVADAEGVLDWRAVADPAEIVLPPGVPDLPVKKLFFPTSETMLQYGYRRDQAAVAATPPPVEAFAVFGVRPCDALAQQVADLVFLGGLPDPYYQARRDAGTIIAVNCTEALPECFCASLNSALTEAPGSDVLLTPIDEATWSRGLPTRATNYWPRPPATSPRPPRATGRARPRWPPRPPRARPGRSRWRA